MRTLVLSTLCLFLLAGCDQPAPDSPPASTATPAPAESTPAPASAPTETATVKAPEGTCGDQSALPSDQRLANTPKWTLSLYGEHERPLTAGLNGYVSANWNWRDRVNFAMNSNPNTALDGYGIFGASFGVGSADERWRASLYVRNLFNKHYPTVIFETPFDSGGYSQFPSPEGFRTVGLTLSVKL